MQDPGGQGLNLLLDAPYPLLLFHTEEDPVAFVIAYIYGKIFVVLRTCLTEVELPEAPFSFYQAGELYVFAKRYQHLHFFIYLDQLLCDSAALGEIFCGA